MYMYTVHTIHGLLWMHNYYKGRGLCGNTQRACSHAFSSPSFCISALPHSDALLCYKNAEVASHRTGGQGESTAHRNGGGPGEPL